MKKIKYLFLTFSIFFFLQYTSGSTPSNGKDAPQYAIDKIPIDLIESSDAIVRTSTEHFTVKTEGTAHYKKHCAITILNDNGKNFGKIVEGYDQFSTLSKITAYLYNSQGKLVRKLKKDELSDISPTAWSSGYGDNRVVIAQMVYDEYPYTIEYEYTKNYKGLMFYPPWTPQWAEDLAVQHSKFVIVTPNSLPLRHHTESNIEPTIEKQAETSIYTWEVEKLKPYEKEPYSSGLVNQLIRVLTAPSDFRIDGYEGNMETWANYGEWYYNLNKGRDELSSATKLKVQELITGAKTKREKVKRIYQYLQDHTRYVSIQLGIGGWQTFEASHVEKNNYGDCKALTNYMQAMLKSAGIDSKPALVRAGRNVRKVCKEFCSVQFNHIFLVVPLEEEKDSLWLECTTQQGPLDYMGSFTDDRNVLLIDQENGSRMIRTPASKAEDNQRIRTIEADILETGGVAAKVNIEYRGIQQDYPRYKATLGSPRDQEEWIQEIIELSGVTINEYEFSEVSKDEPLVILDLDINARQYAAKAGKRLLINPNLLSRHTTVPKKTEERKHPIVFSRPYSYQDEVFYSLPDNYAIESMPKESVNIESEFGTYQANYLLSEDGKLKYTRFFQINKFHLPAERYEDFRQFLLEVSKADKTKVVLVKTD